MGWMIWPPSGGQRRPMHRIGRLHFKGQMGSLRVIDLHCLSHHLPGLSQSPVGDEAEILL